MGNDGLAAGPSARFVRAEGTGVYGAWKWRVMPVLWVALGLLGIASIHDLRTRQIPDWISAALLVAALGALSVGAHPAGWRGLVIGLVLGFSISLALYALGALGGGDVKLLTALGAVLGPAALLSCLFWVAVAGGVLALVAKWRGQKELAYVPAIAAGLLMYLVRNQGMLHAWWS